jgi:hypothetical protein
MDKLIKLLKKMKATEADGWECAGANTCCPGDDWADGYNQAIKDIIHELEKQKTGKGL